MENAVEALKLSAWVIIFMIALSIVFMMFSQVREVSDIILQYNDNTYLAEYELPSDETGGRTVGIETVMPTLYRYYKEKFSVDIKLNGEISEKFDGEVEKNVYTYSDSVDKKYYKDGVPWMAKPNVDIKNRVSAYIDGRAKPIIDGIVNDINGYSITHYQEKGLKILKDGTFSETFHTVENVPDKGVYISTTDGSRVDLIRGTKKNYITYTVQ